MYGTVIYFEFVENKSTQKCKNYMIVSTLDIYVSILSFDYIA